MLKSSQLIVPIQLNAICVEGGRTVMDAVADFSKLPWTNRQADFNGSTPFLGQSVSSPPFQNRNFTMASGVHLHWILPRAHRTYYTGTTSKGIEKSPPAAPNRWLVTRKTDNSQWIVESDYINTDTTVYNRNAVTVPSALLGEQGQQPYYYLGRQLTLNEWCARTANSAEYWQSLGNKPLTAFGYGEMSFNTFYPNCRSVFGFFDPQPGDTTNGIEYDVLGWYYQGDNDIVNVILRELTTLINNSADNSELLKKVFNDQGSCPQWLSDLITNGSGNSGWPSGAPKSIKNYWDMRAQLLLPNATFNLSDLFSLDTTGNSLNEFYCFGIAQALNWSFDGSVGYPDQSYYYGTISVSSGENTSPSFNKIAIGHTGTGALAAYLGSELNGGASATNIEDQLNALLLGGSVQNSLVDIDLNLKEAQHNNEFDARDSGILWRIRKVTQTGDAGADGFQDVETPLTSNVAALLNTLNLEQDTYQKGLEEIAARQMQLYNDWCKYMYSCYPPPGTTENFPDDDDIKSYVTWERENLQALQNRVGVFGPSPESTGNSLTYTATGIQANAVLGALNALNAELVSLNNSLQDTDYQYELSYVPAPRYYRPKDPVVLFASDLNLLTGLKKPSDQALKVFWTDALVINNQAGNALPFTIAELLAAGLDAGLYQCVESWSPQILQWLTEFFPVQQGGNVESPGGDYSTDFVTANSSLVTGEFDLCPEGTPATVRNALVYSGSTYVSSNTKKHLQDALQGFLLKKFPKNLSKADFTRPSETEPKPIVSITWESISEESQPDYTNAGCTALEAYKHLEDKLILTQSLGGFYHALLQHTHNTQLPIKDPLAFSSYKKFTERVNTILQGAYLMAPLPDNRFVPVASGLLNLLELEIIDHFGIGTKASLGDISIARSMTMANDVSGIWLKPRLSQEARLNFRWLAASSPNAGTDIEMNSHPATSPVCGWLLPNYFDQSLMVYDDNGTGLGSFTNEGTQIQWNPFPAATNPISQISASTSGINTHLLSVLLNIQSDNTLSDFLSNLADAQSQISPEYYAGHDTMAILTGKPVAVVRACLSLETKGGLAIDQGWIPFMQQLQGASASTASYEEVTFPVQLGENAQLDDGLIAFWERTAGTISGAPNWVDGNSGDNTIDLTLSSGVKTLTMLMDPHGIVHATSGILPVKTIRIPPGQYTPALKNIEVTFRTQPILTPDSALQLSLPQELGYRWSWLQENTTGWQEIPDLPLITEELFTSAWQQHLEQTAAVSPSAKDLWSDLVSAGWLVSLSENASLFQVVPPDSTITAALEQNNITAEEIATIEKIINANVTGIAPYNPEARFYKKQKLLEGWLKLSPADQ